MDGSGGENDHQSLRCKGSETGFALTDTVGDAYTPEGGAAVLVGVDSTAASVNTALAAINGGTLPGQVPALALITSVDTALTAQVSYETANKAAVDALAATLKLTVADGTSFADELSDVVSASQAARDAVSSTDTTTVLATKASDAAALTAAEYTALGKAGQTKADAYVAAVKADAALTGANAADVTGVKAGLAADAKFDATAISNAAKVDASITSADTLYTFYTAGTTTAAQRTAIDTALKDVPYYSTFKATAVIDSTKNVATQAVTTTKAAVDALDSGKYSADYVAQAAAEKTLADAKAADANVAAAKAQADAYAVKTDATADAVTKLGAFSADGVDLHATTVGAGTLNFAATSTDKDVFYFGTNTPAPGEYTKAALVGANDGAITGFGSGDSIVLGSGFTFNSGALSTGDNNKTEFFLVQKGSDTLVVLETAAYGSSSTLHTATGDTAAVTSPDAAVITLTGVNVADLTVSNGVISHVA